MAELSDEIRRFVRRIVDSVELLEVLLLLRDAPARTWRVDEIDATLRSSKNSVERRLRRLLRAGLVRREADGYRYRADARTDATIGELAALYRTRRLSVIDAIYDTAPTNALQSFSDAFKVAREENDDDAG